MTLESKPLCSKEAPMFLADFSNSTPNGLPCNHISCASIERQSIIAAHQKCHPLGPLHTGAIERLNASSQLFEATATAAALDEMLTT